jgi:hypothetical protein
LGRFVSQLPEDADVLVVVATDTSQRICWSTGTSNFQGGYDKDGKPTPRRMVRSILEGIDQALGDRPADPEEELPIRIS